MLSKHAWQMGQWAPMSSVSMVTGYSGLACSQPTQNKTKTLAAFTPSKYNFNTQRSPYLATSTFD